MDICCSNDRIFIKKAFSWYILPDNSEPLGTMEYLHGNVYGREENGFVQSSAACHLGLMCHTEIVQSLRWQGIWEMRTYHCRWAQILEENRKMCSLDQMQPLLHKGGYSKNDPPPLSNFSKTWREKR